MKCLGIKGYVETVVEKKIELDSSINTNIFLKKNVILDYLFK